MKKIGDNLSKDFLHHAYIIYGPKVEVKNDLSDFLADEMGLTLQNNSDFLTFNEDVLNIDTVRLIIDSAQRKAIKDKKVYLIFFRNIILEAQNALLKVLEEPIENTHFFFVTETRGFAIPTLTSRVIEIDYVDDSKSQNALLGEFLETELNGRLEIIQKLTKDKDRDGAQKLISELLSFINNNHKEKTNLKKALLYASIYISGPSSSIKILLEHIAILFNAEKI